MIRQFCSYLSTDLKLTQDSVHKKLCIFSTLSFLVQSDLCKFLTTAKKVGPFYRRRGFVYSPSFNILKLEIPVKTKICNFYRKAWIRFIHSRSALFRSLVCLSDFFIRSHYPELSAHRRNIQNRTIVKLYDATNIAFIHTKFILSAKPYNRTAMFAPRYWHFHALSLFLPGLDFIEHFVQNVQRFCFPIIVSDFRTEAFRGVIINTSIGERK